MVILFLLCLSSSALLFSQSDRKIRVACVGNSVTYGAGIENREIYAYPAQLQELLGNPYEVGNFGRNGATLLSRGHRPYIQQEEFKKALEFQPDLVVIHLGLNDTAPRNWPTYGKDLIRNRPDSIDSYRNLESQPRLWICKIIPYTTRYRSRKSWATRMRLEISAEIEPPYSPGGTGPIFSRKNSKKPWNFNPTWL